MAYMDFNFARAAVARIDTARAAPPAPVVTDDDKQARFSALEWQVIALAERDRPGSLRRPGTLSLALGALFGGHNPRLADPRLEALRRLAVLSWRRGYAVPRHEQRAFLDAGYRLAHQELLMDSIFAARAERRAEAGRPYPAA